MDARIIPHSCTNSSLSLTTLVEENEQLKHEYMKLRELLQTTQQDTIISLDVASMGQLMMRDGRDEVWEEREVEREVKEGRPLWGDTPAKGELCTELVCDGGGGRS